MSTTSLTADDDDASDIDTVIVVVKTGFLYDRLPKEVINLRKFCEIKESSLHTKDEEIKKVEALTKAMEIEWKKMKREAAAGEKDAASIKSDDNRKIKRSNSTRRFMKEH